jgi:hypothetical protein
MSDSSRRRGRDFSRRQARLRGAQFVSAARLREIFDEAKILERALAGELTPRITYRKPVSPSLPFPPGTHSECTGYFDRNGKQIAEVHCYRLPDDSIGASGKLDPKEVVHNGTLYTLEYR